MSGPAERLTSHTYDHVVVEDDCVPRGDLAVVWTPAVVRLSSRSQLRP